MHKINVDYDKCESCMSCYEACFVDVIRWDEEANKPVVKYPEECATCNWCELGCPNGAIEVIPDNPVQIPEPYPRSFYPQSYSAL